MLKSLEIFLRANSPERALRKIFVQENLLNLSKNNKNWWHFPHPQLMMEAPIQAGTAKNMGPTFPSSQSGATVSPQEDQVAEALFQTRRAVRFRATFHHPQLIGQKLYSRHDRIRIMGPNPLDPSLLVGRDSMPGEQGEKPTG